MKKKTKKSSYKNAIAIAVASFASIALISTGLAAFVIVKDADASAGGSISVEKVVDSGLALAINDVSAVRNIIFDAAPGDVDGRVILGHGHSGEVLTHTITGTIEIGDKKSIMANAKLDYTFNIKEGSTPANTEFSNHFLKADTDGKTRVDLATGLVLGEATNLPITVNPTDQSKGTFEIVVGFQWGSKYKNMNPSLYYDDDADGKEVSNDDVATDLETLFTETVYTFELALIASANK